MLHKHKCENPYCALIWEHEVPDTTGMDKSQGHKFYEAGHMCPQCKTGPYYERYFANSQEREKFMRERLEEFLGPLVELFEKYTGGNDTTEEAQVFHL